MTFSAFGRDLPLQNNTSGKNPLAKQQPDFLPLILLFLAGFVFLVIRAKYGFCFNDEAFCVTLGQRLYQGDALVAEEWHGCQPFSGVMLPLYALFRVFSPTNEGILLFLRYCYCVFWWICSVYVSVSIAKKPLPRCLIFLYLLFFSPMDYMTVSYTSMGLISALVIFCILYQIPVHTRSFKPAAVIAFSFFWAILVLCSPFMVIAFVGLLAVAVIGYIYEKKKGKRLYFHNLFSMLRYAVFIDGALAVCYIGFFLLGRAELSTILESIPHILADPEHQSDGILSSMRWLVYLVLTNSPVYITVCFLTFLYGLVAKPGKIRLPLFALNAGLYVLTQIQTVSIEHNFNAQMLHIVFLGAAAFALLKNKNFKLFLSAYGVAVCYSLLNGVASNTELIAVSMTATVAGCAAIVFLVQLAAELLEQYPQKKALKSLSAILICVVLGLQISSEFYLKLTSQYWDDPPYALTDTITCGAAKGLKTSSGSAYHYMLKYESLHHLLSQVDTTGKTFLSCTSAPYLYLDADLEFATFSAWSFGYGDGLNDRLLDYQKLNPGKVPDLIYCASEEDMLPLIDETYEQYEYNGQYLFVKQ